MPVTRQVSLLYVMDQRQSDTRRASRRKTEAGFSTHTFAWVGCRNKGGVIFPSIPIDSEGHDLRRCSCRSGRGSLLSLELVPSRLGGRQRCGLERALNGWPRADGGHADSAALWGEGESQNPGLTYLPRHYYPVSIEMQGRVDGAALRRPTMFGVRTPLVQKLRRQVAGSLQRGGSVRVYLPR